MGTPYLSEIRMMTFNFAPKGWATCNGQFLPINQNQALFSLLGTTYGGNGQTTFSLPDLRGRTPIHRGGEFSSLGQTGGTESVTISAQQMPLHTHRVNASSDAATVNVATGNRLAVSSSTYTPPSNLTALGATEVSSFGGSQPHNNMQPFTVLNFCIALQGAFPSQN